MNHNNPKLKHISQSLRRNMTEEERHLWYDCLKQLEETVKCQHVIGPYIVDFYCAAAKLVIELDGWQHYENPEQDIVRDRYLNELGLIVKRYSNSDLHLRFSAVCEDIYETIRTRKRLLLEEKLSADRLTDEV